MKRLAVFASGRGSNFRAIVAHVGLGVLQNIEACLLVTNDASAPVIAIAKENAIPAEFVEGVWGRKFATRDDREKARNRFDEQAVEILKQYRIDLVALAGFMQVLGQPILQPYLWRIMNIHPAKNLVRFGGRGMFGERVHAAVINSGEKESGCTIHYVDYSIDRGPTIIQATVPVEREDTPESLAERVLVQEHRTYSKAIQLHVDERVKVADGKVVIDWAGDWEQRWNRRQEPFIRYQEQERLLQSST